MLAKADIREPDVLGAANHDLCTQERPASGVSPLPPKANPPFYSKIDTTSLKLLKDVMDQIRKPLGFQDCQVGSIYAARSLSSNRSMVKVGYTACDDDSRLKAISERCHEDVLQSFKSSYFIGAHRVEQIFHAYLKPSNFSRYDCKCGHVNIEWYDASYEWLVGLILMLERWMLGEPYDIKPEQQLLFIADWDELQKQKDKFDKKVMGKKQDELVLKYNFGLKVDWAAALLEWENSLRTQNPITLHEFLAKGLSVRCTSRLPLTPSVQRLINRRLAKYGYTRSSFERRHSTPPGPLSIRRRPSIPHSDSARLLSRAADVGDNDFLPRGSGEGPYENVEGTVRSHSDSQVILQSSSGRDTKFRVTVLLQLCLTLILLPLEEHVAASIAHFWLRCCSDWPPLDCGCSIAYLCKEHDARSRRRSLNSSSSGQTTLSPKSDQDEMSDSLMEHLCTDSNESRPRSIFQESHIEDFYPLPGQWVAEDIVHVDEILQIQRTLTEATAVNITYQASEPWFGTRDEEDVTLVDEDNPGCHTSCPTVTVSQVTFVTMSTPGCSVQDVIETTEALKTCHLVGEDDDNNNEKEEREEVIGDEEEDEDNDVGAICANEDLTTLLHYKHPARPSMLPTPDITPDRPSDERRRSPRLIEKYNKAMLSANQAPPSPESPSPAERPRRTSATTHRRQR